MDSGSRKRLRRTRDNDEGEVEEAQRSIPINDGLLESSFPKSLEGRFATAIFELGLKHSSPKILMPLMPSDANLSTEHIKSHLQKYRIHRQRSKDEFMEFYNNYMKEPFQQWEADRGWKRKQHNQQSSNSYGDQASHYKADSSLYFNQLHTSSEQDDGNRVGSSIQSRLGVGVSTIISPAEEKDAYINDLYRDAEAMLHILQGHCQEAVQGSEDLKLKPDILKGLMSGMK